MNRALQIAAIVVFGPTSAALFSLFRSLRGEARIDELDLIPYLETRS
jgi:hypothetical protein